VRSHNVSSQRIFTRFPTSVEAHPTGKFKRPFPVSVSVLNVQQVAVVSQLTVHLCSTLTQQLLSCVLSPFLVNYHTSSLQNVASLSYTVHSLWLCGVLRTFGGRKHRLLIFGQCPHFSNSTTPVCNAGFLLELSASPSWDYVIIMTSSGLFSQTCKSFCGVTEDIIQLFSQAE